MFNFRHNKQSLMGGDLQNLLRELVFYFAKTTVFQLLIGKIIQCDTKYKFRSNLSSIGWILTIFCDLNLWPFEIFTSQETYLKSSVPVGYVWWSRWRIVTCWKLTNIQNNWPDQQIQSRMFDFQVTRRHFSNDTSCNKLCCICFSLILCLIINQWTWLACVLVLFR